MFMSVLDISIINVAIPTMQRDFAATTDQIQWVENAYSLALGVVVPVSAWMAARFGPGRVYILSLLGLRRQAPRCAGWPGTSTASSPSACCRPCRAVCCRWCR